MLRYEQIPAGNHEGSYRMSFPRMPYQLIVGQQPGKQPRWLILLDGPQYCRYLCETQDRPQALHVGRIIACGLMAQWKKNAAKRAY